MTVPFSDLQAIAPSAIIELFVLELNVLQHGVNDIYRFHAGTSLNANGDLVWAGNTYQRMPIEVDGFEYGGQGQLPRPKMRVSNVFGMLTAVLLTLPSGLEQAKVTRIRTLARYLDGINFPGATNPYGTPDPTAEFPREIYYVDRKTTENRDVIEFELAAAFDLQGVRAPKRQCVANICPWVYRSTECGYTEANYWTADDQPTANPALDVCGKRLSSCELRFNRIQQTGSTTAGSTTLTIASTAGLLAGQPVAGLGIPAGTTVSSVTNATTLVMTAAATITTSGSKTGTASATAATLSVADTVGLGTGMTVTGLYVPTGTTISSIAGTTLTLNQRPYSINRSGTYYYQLLSFPSRVQMNTTGLSVGMRVWGSNSINTTILDVFATYITLNNYGTLTTKRASVDLYFMPATPSASTYTFTVTPVPIYSFRSEDTALAFGGFPGIGTYFT